MKRYLSYFYNALLEIRMMLAASFIVWNIQRKQIDSHKVSFRDR